jgi:hypothetical protein
MTEALIDHRRACYTGNSKEKQNINLPEALITVPESTEKIFFSICMKGTEE